jgi:hypothetical protein
MPLTGPCAAIFNNSQDEEYRKALNWISSLDFREAHRSALALRQEGTGTWLLEEPAYIEWTNGSVKTLWCRGMRKFIRLLSAKAEI